ncbi:bursicon-like [Mytilus trossulus]|uniref:bursicon-like n=1 Tax=Mytilus trossulus TaxID=6551 RepID=UPI003005E5D2
MIIKIYQSSVFTNCFKMPHTALIACVILGVFITLSAAQCEKKFIIHTIKLKDINCPQKRIISYGCMGTCTSYTRPSSTNFGQLEHHCQCCQDAEKIFARVRIYCPHKVYVVTLAVPRECSCRPCSLLPDHIIPSEPDFLQNKRSFLKLVGVNSTRNL